MNEELYAIVLERLEVARLPKLVEAIVLAASEGPGELEAHLGGERPPEARLPRFDRTEIPGIFLSSVEVQGFRGIGARIVLEIPEGPGLTLVVGRNGSGKSSLAEALDYSFTGANRRWEGKGAQSHWRDGWRNLHFEGPTEIRTHLRVEGSTHPSTLTWTWPPGQGLDGGRQSYEVAGKASQDPGWSDALSAYRPFLSYSELGAMLEGRPVDLYKALSAGLGLEELERAREEIRQVRLDGSRRINESKNALQPILTRLADLDDPRAKACSQALASRRWNLDSVEEVLAGGTTGNDREVETLRQLRALDGPELDRIASLCDLLRQFSHDCRSVAGSEAERDLALADVLERALELHRHHGDQACPVCGAGTLDEEWRSNGMAKVEQLRRRAAHVQAVRKAAEAVRSEAHDYFGSRPLILERARELDLDFDFPAMEEAWNAWLTKGAISDLDRLAEHLEERGTVLCDVLQSWREMAGGELDRRQSAWLPLARDLAAWLPGARIALAKGARVEALQQGENWLKTTTGEIQRQRFRPISGKAAHFWDLLRQQSNVDLREVCLAGTGSHGRVDLEVTVDGKETAALGVMSQGELFSLALSLFLPRATRPESPFRFLVIDDPVQSMDPSRVDGLARVLEECAGSRQVVVFTHDSRLSESVRRLDIDARIIEVVREPDSKVRLEVYSDTVGRYLDDARALILTENLPSGARRRAVPVLCRMALEAACDEALRRRWLAEGVSHLEIEGKLASSPKLYGKAGLVLSSDPNRPEDVAARLRNIGPWAVETFQKCNRGAHAAVDENFAALVANAGKLAEKLRRAK